MEGVENERGVVKIQVDRWHSPALLSGESTSQIPKGGPDVVAKSK
jgi:hypothetical protein